MKVCGSCKKPFLSDDGYCPRCPSAHNLDPDSWGHLGCLLLMLLPILLVVIILSFLFTAFLAR